MEKLVFSTQEIANLLGISKSYAYEMVRQGIIPSMRLGKHKRLIPKEMFYNWLGEQSGNKKELDKSSFFNERKEDEM